MKDSYIKIPRNFLSNIISYMLYVYIPIDMLNGFVLVNYGLSISLSYKALVLVLITLFLMKKNKIVIILLLHITILIYILINIFNPCTTTDSVTHIDWLVKFIGIVLYFLFFKELIVEGRHDKLVTFVKLSFLFLSLNFLLAFLGFGYEMYSNNVGRKGFIYAGNELSVAIITTTSILQILSLETRNYLKFLGITVVSLGMAAILTSKVAIFGVFIVSIILLLIHTLLQIQNFKVPKKIFSFWAIAIVFFPIVFISVIYYALYYSNLWKRISYFYEKLDIVTLLFSHRNLWATEALQAYLNNFTFFEQLFGKGKVWYSFISDQKMVEIDFIDFLMTYGILGVIFIISFFTFILILLFKNKQQNPYFYYLLFIDIFILGISLTAGHVFNSGISGAILGAIFALSAYKKQTVLFSIHKGESSK